MKKEVSNILLSYANSIAPTVYYDNWSDKFSRQEVKEQTEKMIEKLKKYVNISEITQNEAIELGFMKWSDDSDLFLIPLWLISIIPIGTHLESILGNKIIYDGNNIDLDIRGGCIAFGIHIDK